MKQAVVAIGIILAVLLGTMAHAQGPIFFTKHVTVVSTNKAIMADLAAAAKKVGPEDFKTLVYDMLTLREVIAIPKGITIECLFDAGDVCYGRVIDTTFETWSLIGEEFWFITLTIPLNIA